MRKDLSEGELFALVTRLERFAKLTDSKFKIPGTNIPIGIDALIGFIPVIGELVGAALSLYFLLEARKVGAPLSLKLRMILNILIDFAIGLVPIIGDIADIGFRSNVRNMKLLVEHIQNERGRAYAKRLNEERKATWIIGILAITVITILLIATI
jgi:hypothetical protein